MKEQIVLKIYGRVQMVLYRDSARRRAKKLELVGYVMNQSDGTVEVIAEGEKEKLEEFINWCYNGPILAKVEKINIDWKKATDQFDNFKIKY